MAEMASINPTVGAQYRWSALYAPKGFGPPAFWGLVQGWITVFGWMAVVASPAFLVGTVAQGLIVLNNESYVPKNWHGTLLTWALLAIPAFCNIFARKILSTIEIIGGITHTLFWVVWIVVLLTMARRSSTEYVFTETYSGAEFGGWPNKGVSWCVGLLTAAFPLSGIPSHFTTEPSNHANARQPSTE
jgi:choline transport protein